MVVLPLSLTAEPDMMPGGPEMDAVACCLFFSLFLFFVRFSCGLFVSCCPATWDRIVLETGLAWLGLSCEEGGVVEGTVPKLRYLHSHSGRFTVWTVWTVRVRER